MIRVAFLLSLSDQWAGGVSYYENLFKAIRSVTSKSETALIGVLPAKGSLPERVLSLLDEIYEVPPSDFSEKLRVKVFDWISPRLFLRRFAPELAQSRLLRKVKADIAFTTLLPGYRKTTPFISWIPDFQFKYMPDLFSPELRKWLESHARDLGRYSDAVVLSSHAALEDFRSLLPSYAEKGRTLQFVSWVDPNVYQNDPSWICGEYGLNERFFYLPNQFWKHKNHEIVLDALEIARASLPDIQVVSTGLLSDHRHLTYPSEFLTAVSRRKLRQNFIALGYVPRAHLYSLMRQSIAVLQPSLFEGWNTSIEEAKSLGKRVLMSDIPVHREQNPPCGTFFPPHDAQALADSMVSLWKTIKPGPDLKLEEDARSRLPFRMKDFGEKFLAIVKEIL